MRLRVKVKNAKECQIELNFPDLCIKYSNGFSPALKVKEGEEIPLDVCDTEDIRKSLLAGSLKGYLSNGWIEEIKDEPILVSIPLPIEKPSQFIAEQDIKVLPIDLPAPKILPDISVIPNKSVPKNDQITDLNLVTSYDDFIKLSHFLKLQFIKETNNLDLLRDISSKTPSSQFKNNIQLRLSSVKI